MDIQQQTKNVAAQGRFGDSMLLHVNPAEVKGLASAMPITINPETGQPEAFLPFLAPILGSMIGGSLLTGATLGGLAAGGLSAAAAAGIGAGLATYAQTGGSGSKALLSGLTAGMGTSALGNAASAGTQAGIVVGAKAMNSNIPVLGIGVNAPKKLQEEKVYKLSCETSEYMGLSGLVKRDDIVANCDYVGDGYGVPTKGMNDAILLLARLEGLLFDPVYSGKGLAGMIDLIGRGYFKNQRNIVFIHTGGATGLFAYHDLLSTK